MASNVLFEDYFDISEQIKKDVDTFFIPLGITEENIFETLSVPHNPHRHILVTGQPGSGKSNFLHGVLNSVFLNHSADQAQFWLHDCKGFEYRKLQEQKPAHITHFSTGNSTLSCEALIQKLDEEYKKRIRLLREKQVQTFDAYQRKEGSSCLPRLLVLIDDFDTFLWCCEDNSNLRYLVDNLLRMGFALGVTFIVTAQTCNHPWYMSRLIEMYFGIRIILAHNEMCIREQIENPEAVELAKTLRRGEALVMEPNIHKVKTLYLSSEIENKIASICCDQN